MFPMRHAQSSSAATNATGSSRVSRGAQVTDARRVVGRRLARLRRKPRPRAAAGVQRVADAAARFPGGVDWPRIETRRSARTLHYRGVPDEDAQVALDPVADERGRRLRRRYGRKVLELLPPLEADKAAQSTGCSRGTDSTRALRRRRHDRTRCLPSTRRLKARVRVAVASARGTAGAACTPPTSSSRGPPPCELLRSL